MRVSVVTMTADRPLAFALAERWMARQTRQPDEWVVADGGQAPVVCTRGQVVTRESRPAGVENFVENLRRGLALATGDMIVLWEDDEWYSPVHLERLIGLFRPETLAVGDDLQRYYHVASRQWRTFDNVGASLCQTAIRLAAVPCLLAAAAASLERQSYGVDRAFWDTVPTDRQILRRQETVVGMKGLPGQAGLGKGHRPDRAWIPDQTLLQLRAWIGSDVSAYTAVLS